MDPLLERLGVQSRFSPSQSGMLRPAYSYSHDKMAGYPVQFSLENSGDITVEALQAGPVPPRLFFPCGMY